ncbi:hypothetical protein Bca52824_025715 [Brassica carinata]|uniref:F-box domain-containing protein n=1 Tax=Brassica carinata TaxID=52824 RepID=A0A8X7SH66_BRACI|nr:hypothetical protein Bca52824_025715 [Brassica carinata]
MDHFSDLPDEVLLHILSFLTTKEAAFTSVLAKRWRNLVAFVPYLTIDDSEFLHPEEGKRDRKEIKHSFVDFVDRVLTLQANSPLKKLSLQCCVTVPADRDRLDGWINNALAPGVSDLDLRISCDNYHLSPKCFECCSTLVSLKIHHPIAISLVAVAAGRTILLPLLKTLVLDSVFVCPNEFEILLRVSSASVKTLTIELGACLSTLSFDTPNLLHFKYSGSVAEDYPVVNLGNLLDAQIFFLVHDFDLEQLREPDDNWLGDTVSLQYSNVWKLFHGIPNVPNLDLCPNALEVLSLCYESMPGAGFNNLKSLTIRSDEDRGWQAMPALLRNCPPLETLVIKGLVHHVTDKCGDVCDCISREDEGLSLTLCPVKVMEIHGFQGTAKEMRMIKHFLDYLPSLKKMEVYAEENDLAQLAYQRVLEIFELCDKLSNCNVQLWI